MPISRFSDMLGGLDAVESSGDHNKELQKDKLLKRDVLRIVGSVLPYIPAVDVISGSLTTGKHVFSHVSKKAGDAFANA